MIRRFHNGGLVPLLLFLGLALLPARGTMARAEQVDQPAPVGIGKARMAVLVHIAWQEVEGAVLDPTRLRIDAASRLEEVLAAQGYPVVSAEELSPLVIRWRVRSSLRINDAFLNSVREDLGVEHLLLARLFLQPGQLIIAWRVVDTGSGWLLGAGFLGVPVGLGEEERTGIHSRVEKGVDGGASTGIWLQAITEAARSLMLEHPASNAPEASSTILLPVVSIGSDFGSTTLAGHCLLVELLGGRLVSVPDPGLVVTWLQDEGFDPGQMSPGIRESLRRRFDADLLLSARLISFDKVETREFAMDPEYDIPLSAAGGGPLEEFAASLTRIDPHSGRILSSRLLYDDQPVEYGWFGVQHRYSLLERLQAVMAELWDGEKSQPLGR